MPDGSERAAIFIRVGAGLRRIVPMPAGEALSKLLGGAFQSFFPFLDFSYTIMYGIWQFYRNDSKFIREGRHFRIFEPIFINRIRITFNPALCLRAAPRTIALGSGLQADPS